MGLRKRADAPVEDLTPRSVDDLCTALVDPDAEVRRRAALDLHGERAAVPALVAAFGAEADRAVRDALLTTLAGHDGEDVAGALSAHLRSDLPEVRNAAVVALRSMPAGVEHVVGPLLADDDPDVRILAVMVLAELPHPAVPAWLTGVVDADAHENVVASAADAAVTLGRSDVAVAAARRFPANPYLRFLAARVAG